MSCSTRPPPGTKRRDDDGSTACRQPSGRTSDMSEQLAAIQERTFARSRPSTSTSFGPATRLTAEQLSRYLDRRRFAVACTSRPDGRPHAAMTSFFRRDDVFWLPTVADSVRGHNILSQAWVSLV